MARRRYLTREQVAAGRGHGVGRAALDGPTVQRALVEGYAARGPWEVERTSRVVELRHYGHTVAYVRRDRDGPWERVSVRPRPGFGLSRSDAKGVRTLTYTMGIESPSMKPGVSPYRRYGMNRPFAPRRGETVFAAHDPHSKPSHHVGPCDAACRAGKRVHYHRFRRRA